MGKQSPQSNPHGQVDPNELTVWGERRKEPDWDTYVAALLAFALREVGDEDAEDGAKP